MPLDAQTEERLKELFGGRFCSVCSLPAKRLFRNEFYCDACLPKLRVDSTVSGSRAVVRREDEECRS